FLAYRNIKKNKGSATAGYDGVTIKDIEKLACGDFLTIIKRRFKDYRPRKVKRVEIPKPNGKLRPLGIPSIWDRIVQQCILQILEPICEAKFNKHSYGFRPNCSTENAIADCLARINQSKMNYVVDIDIKGFFDEVNHTKLMRQIWTMGIRDKQLLVIIRKMLKAPIVMRNGNVVFPTKGTPQGGILSPLLANICLNEFDWWIANQWEERTVKELKHHYRKNGAWDKGNIYSKLRSHTSLKEMYLVRYADDFKIFCRTGEEAQRAF
ncbi:reverse transcriptase domain-containing protein, partial [Enterococcus faecium]